MEFKDKLKKLRLDKGLTQKELADITDISLPAIEKYEQGAREPKKSYLKRLSEALDVDSKELIICSERFKEFLKMRKETDEQVKKNLKTIEALINESLSCIYWSKGEGECNNYLYSIEAYLGDAKEKINSTISYLEKEYDF